METDTVYCAAPLFTEQDNKTLDFIEDLLKNLPDIKYFSPRDGEKSIDFGAAKDRTEKAKLAQSVYQENVDGIVAATIIIANTDSTTFMNSTCTHSDVGTAWELGYGAASKKKVITYSAQGFGLNIMLSCSSDCHLPNLPALREFMTRWKVDGEDYDDLCIEMSSIDGSKLY